MDLMPDTEAAAARMLLDFAMARTKAPAFATRMDGERAQHVRVGLCMSDYP